MGAKTLGVAGDFTDIGAMFEHYVAAGGLPENETVTQISDFTESLGIRNDVGISFGGHTLRIENPDKYEITIPSSAMNHYLMFASNPSAFDVFDVDGLIIKCPHYLDGPIILGFQSVGAIVSVNFKCKNVVIIGQGTAGSNPIGIYSGGSSGGCNSQISNCKVYNIGTGIRVFSSWAHIVAAQSFVENNTVYGCGTGLYISGDYGLTLGIRGKNNCFAMNTGVDVAINTTYDPANYHQLTNCADSDGTIGTCGAVQSGTVTGVDVADFLSVDPTSADFLKVDSLSALFEKGTPMVSSWNTSDLAGRTRPMPSGLVNIGAYETATIERDVTLQIKRDSVWYPVTKTIQVYT